MKKKIGRILVPALVMLILAASLVLYVMFSPAEARVVGGNIEDRLGTYSGAGSGQSHNVKASLDLAHTDLDAMITYDTDALALLGYGNSNIYYVDSGTAGSAGTTWATAVATIDDAINLVGTAVEGDTGAIIFVAAGHAETLTAADDVDIDQPGVKIIGLGVGENRPTLTYTTNGEVVIGNDDVEIHNINFIAGNAVAHAIDVETGSENWVINNCRFAVTTLNTDEFTDCITTTANSDNGRITNCRFEMGAASADAAIQNVGCDFVEISDNIISGDFATACIEDKTTASIWLIIKNNILVNGTVGGTAGLNTVACISLKTDTSAIIVDNKLFTNVASPDLSIVAADGLLSGNTYCEAEGTYAGSQPVAGWGKINNLVATSSAMTAGNGYGAADDPVLFTVTGDVMVRCFATVDTSVTSTSNDTIELGVTGDTACILVQDVVDATALVAGDVWTLTQAGDTPSAEWDGEWVILATGTDILLTIDDHDLTAGVITYYLQWVALSPDGNITDSVD